MSLYWEKIINSVTRVKWLSLYLPLVRGYCWEQARACAMAPWMVVTTPGRGSQVFTLSVDVKDYVIVKNMTSHSPVVAADGAQSTALWSHGSSRGGGEISGGAFPTTTNQTELTLSAEGARARPCAGGRSLQACQPHRSSRPGQEGQPFRNRLLKPIVNRHALPDATLTNHTLMYFVQASFAVIIDPV